MNLEPKRWTGARARGTRRMRSGLVGRHGGGFMDVEEACLRFLRERGIGGEGWTGNDNLFPEARRGEKERGVVTLEKMVWAMGQK